MPSGAKWSRDKIKFCHETSFVEFSSEVMRISVDFSAEENLSNLNISNGNTKISWCHSRWQNHRLLRPREARKIPFNSSQEFSKGDEGEMVEWNFSVQVE
jgi:hypothetical protein